MDEECWKEKGKNKFLRNEKSMEENNTPATAGCMKVKTVEKVTDFGSLVDVKTCILRLFSFPWLMVYYLFSNVFLFSLYYVSFF